MPLQWKTTTIGKTTITHWRQHEPKALLSALSAKPLAELGKHPKVRRHKFGRLHLAVREFEPFSGRYNTAENSFAILRQLAEQRAAFVELPVALVSQNQGNKKVVTAWKKDMRDLHDFLRGDQISDRLKDKACISAAEITARLHSTGFIHGHLKPDNFLVDRSGKSHLVDYTLMRQPENLNVLGQMEMQTVVEAIAAARYPSSIPRHWESREVLARLMQRKYYQTVKRQRAKDS